VLCVIIVSRSCVADYCAAGCSCVLVLYRVAVIQRSFYCTGGYERSWGQKGFSFCVYCVASAVVSRWKLRRDLATRLARLNVRSATLPQYNVHFPVLANKLPIDSIDFGNSNTNSSKHHCAREGNCNQRWWCSSIRQHWRPCMAGAAGMSLQATAEPG